MAQTVKHAKVSGVPDGSDPNQIQPSNWNADHTVTGTVDYSELSGKPSTFPPGTHTHVIADTTGLQTALDTKVAGPASSVADAPTIFNGTTGKLVKETTYASFKTSLSLTKSDVGLGNVDNTSDANKPVSTAQQTALNLKADLASPTFTGDPKAPTPSPGDNDTSIATTAYVTAAVSAGTTAAPRASTTEVLTGTDNVKIVTADAAAALWEKGPDVLSAATISLGEGGFFHITGTNAITDVDFATAKDGRQAWVVFDGVVTLTHSATLQLPGDANIITAAGDRACFVQDVGDTVICVSYLRDSGKPVAGGASVSIGDAPPSTPDPGALWWESDTGRLMIWYDDGTSQQWVEVLAGGSNTLQAASSKITVFTVSGTYTPTVGMRYCIVEAVGGGGGGGECTGNATHSLSAGGGGSGGYSRSTLTEAQIGASQTVTVGAGGIGGVAGTNSAQPGTATSLGSLVVANGGGGGGGVSNATFPVSGIGGVAGTGTIATPGNPGSVGSYATITTVACGNSNGGASYFGGAGRGCPSNGGNGNAATGYGSGGGGAGRLAVASNTVGGAGLAGVLIITEYIF